MNFNGNHWQKLKEKLSNASLYIKFKLKQTLITNDLKTFNIETKLKHDSIIQIPQNKTALIISYFTQLIQSNPPVDNKFSPLSKSFFLH